MIDDILDGYVAKPVEFDRLVAEVSRVAADRRAACGLSPQPAPTVEADGRQPCEPAIPPRPTCPAFSRLQDLVDGDLPLMRELVELFRASRPEIIAGLAGALHSGQLDDIAHWGHRYKGSLLNIGANESAALAAEIEQAGHGVTLEAACGASVRLEVEVDALLPLLDADLAAAGRAG